MQEEEEEGLLRPPTKVALHSCYPSSSSSSYSSCCTSNLPLGIFPYFCICTCASLRFEATSSQGVSPHSTSAAQVCIFLIRVCISAGMHFCPSLPMLHCSPFVCNNWRCTRMQNIPIRPKVKLCRSFHRVLLPFNFSSCTRLNDTYPLFNLCKILLKYWIRPKKAGSLQKSETRRFTEFRNAPPVNCV